MMVCSSRELARSLRMGEERLWGSITSHYTTVVSPATMSLATPDREHGQGSPCHGDLDRMATSKKAVGGTSFGGGWMSRAKRSGVIFGKRSARSLAPASCLPLNGNARLRTLSNVPVLIRKSALTESFLAKRPSESKRWSFCNGLLLELGSQSKMRRVCEPHSTNGSSLRSVTCRLDK